MITPMLTQLTYEGLIDEIVGISNSEFIHDLSRSRKRGTDFISAYVELPANIVNPPVPESTPASTAALATTPVQAEKKKKYQLSSSTDPLFGELRDVNFAALGPLLSSTARRLNTDFDVRGVLFPVFSLLTITSRVTNVSWTEST
jgi:vacuolar protein sorting-associated protein 33A